MQKVVRQDQVGCERVRVALRIERIVLLVFDILAAAEQDAAPVVVPMSQLMPDRKTAALRAAAEQDAAPVVGANVPAHARSKNGGAPGCCGC